MNPYFELLITLAGGAIALWLTFFIIDFKRRREGAKRFDAFIKSVESGTVNWEEIAPPVRSCVNSQVREQVESSVWEQLNNDIWKQIEE